MGNGVIPHSTLLSKSSKPIDSGIVRDWNKPSIDAMAEYDFVNTSPTVEYMCVHARQTTLGVC